MTDSFTGDFFKLIGKPMLWNSEVYGVTAVHVVGISPNGRVAKISIDGGEASRQAQTFPELSDGIGFAILGELAKRPTRTRKIVAGKSARQTEGFDVASTQTEQFKQLTAPPASGQFASRKNDG